MSCNRKSAPVIRHIEESSHQLFEGHPLRSQSAIEPPHSEHRRRSVGLIEFGRPSKMEVCIQPSEETC